MNTRNHRVQLGAFVLMVLMQCSTLPSFAWAKEAAFYVPLNRSELITTSTDMGEVIITDPEVADVYVHGRNKVSVIGKLIGQTTLRIFDGKNNLLRSMDVVVTYDLPAIRRALKEFLPNERIGVELVNTRIALTGNISSAESAATAMEIAEQFLRGKLRDGETTRRTKSQETATETSPILNLMKISAGQQVMLRIRIGEIQRSAIKSLGVNLAAVRNNNFGFDIGTGLGAVADAFIDSEFSWTGSDSGFGASLSALERDGLFKILAEPNLVALSGEQAEFLAGGEFPIPVAQGGNASGAITVEYRQFGVALRFTPYVLSDQRIRIQVQPEVSEISNERTFNSSTGGSTFVIPSITTRRASTTVELAPGESFMIAGLIRDNITSQIDQIPGAGEIPILSALTRSTAFQRNESELVIAVTPYLVDPLASGDIKMPTDNFRPASFMEGVFYGAMGKIFGTAAATSQTPSLEGPVGFITD